MQAKIILFIIAMALSPKAIAEGEVAPTGNPTNKPFRTFINVQRYSVENNGEKNNPTSQTRLEIKFPNGSIVKLPENGGYWTIGNGQTQEINRTFEVPYAYVQQDGVKFSVQLYRKGSKMGPCDFDSAKLSEYNRAYVCHTDVNFQASKNVAQDKIDREGIQIRVFTDLNSTPNEIPQDSLALK